MDHRPHPRGRGRHLVVRVKGSSRRGGQYRGSKFAVSRGAVTWLASSAAAAGFLCVPRNWRVALVRQDDRPSFCVTTFGESTNRARRTSTAVRRDSSHERKPVRPRVAPHRTFRTQSTQEPDRCASSGVFEGRIHRTAIGLLLENVDARSRDTTDQGPFPPATRITRTAKYGIPRYLAGAFFGAHRRVGRGGLDRSQIPRETAARGRGLASQRGSPLRCGSFRGPRQSVLRGSRKRAVLKTISGSAQGCYSSVRACRARAGRPPRSANRFLTCSCRLAFAMAINSRRQVGIGDGVLAPRSVAPSTVTNCSERVCLESSGGRRLVELGHSRRVHDRSSRPRHPVAGTGELRRFADIVTTGPHVPALASRRGHRGGDLLLVLMDPTLRHRARAPTSSRRPGHHSLNLQIKHAGELRPPWGVPDWCGGQIFKCGR